MFMFGCSCSQTRNARSVGNALSATGETAHMPHLRRIRLIVLMELHDPCVQSTSYSPKDRIADGIWSRLPEQMPTFCEEHGSNNDAREKCEFYRRRGRDRCSAVGGNAGGIGRGPAQARQRPAWGLGGGGARARPVGR